MLRRILTLLSLAGLVVSVFAGLLQLAGPIQLNAGPRCRHLHVKLEPGGKWSVLYNKNGKLCTRDSIIIQELRTEAPSALPAAGTYRLVGLGDNALRLATARVSAHRPYARDFTSTTLTVHQDVWISFWSVAVIFLLLASCSWAIPVYFHRVCRPPTLCLQCGCSLRGQTGTCCPECGLSRGEQVFKKTPGTIGRSLPFLPLAGLVIVLASWGMSYWQFYYRHWPWTINIAGGSVVLAREDFARDETLIKKLNDFYVVDTLGSTLKVWAELNSKISELGDHGAESTTRQDSALASELRDLWERVSESKYELGSIIRSYYRHGRAELQHAIGAEDNDDGHSPLDEEIDWFRETETWLDDHTREVVNVVFAIDDGEDPQQVRNALHTYAETGIPDLLSLKEQWEQRKTQGISKLAALSRPTRSGFYGFEPTTRWSWGFESSGLSVRQVQEGRLAVPLWLFAMLFAVLMTTWWAMTRARLNRCRQRWKSGLCVGCGYDLQGLNETRCPECNTPFEKL